MEPVLIFKEMLKCPLCGKNTLEHSEYIYDSGVSGVLLISVFSCDNCGYNEKFVKPFEERKSVEIQLEVKDPEDLNVLVYRSSEAELELPELGISSKPGELYQGIITTVEGLLEDIENEVGELCTQECVNNLERAKKGEINFTLILRDPSGYSFIKSEKAKVIQL